MMFKSAVVALAAVQGVVAQGGFQPETVDVCNPLNDNKAACNKVSIFTAACESLPDVAARQECFCKGESGEIFQKLQNECRQCKVDNGIAGPETDKHSKKIQEDAIKDYCPPNQTGKKYDEVYAEASKRAGDYPPIGPGNMPSKKTSGPAPSTVDFPEGFFASQHLDFSGNGYKVTLDQSFSILAGLNKAPVAKPTNAPFPTNNTGGAGGVEKIDVELNVLFYDCWCVVSGVGIDAVATRECKAPVVAPSPALKEVSIASLKIEQRAAIFVGTECGAVICAGAQGSITIESNTAFVQASIIASITGGGAAAPAQPQQQPKKPEDCIPAPGQNGASGGKTQVTVENKISTGPAAQAPGAAAPAGPAAQAPAGPGAAAPAGPGAQAPAGPGAQAPPAGPGPGAQAPAAPAGPGAQAPAGPGAQAPSGPSGSQSPSGTTPAGPGAVAPAAPGKSGNANIPEAPKANKSGNANIPQTTRPAASTVTGAAVTVQGSVLAVVIAAFAAAAL